MTIKPPTPQTTPSSLLPVPQKLLSNKVVVRAYVDDDARHVFDAVEESRLPLKRWMPWVDTVKTIEDRLVYVREMQALFLKQTTDLVYGIFDKSNGSYLGGTGLHRINWQTPSFEIGYWLRASAHGNGFCTEATRLLTAAAFETLGAARVEIRCDAENNKSANVPRRLGYDHEATLKCDRRNTAGELSDTLVFALTWDNWTSRLKRSS
jgi:ribosomal-protein-serine acetyltransferase